MKIKLITALLASLTLGAHAGSRTLLIADDARNLAFAGVKIEKVAAGTSGTEEVCSSNEPGDCRDFARTVYVQAVVVKLDYDSSSNGRWENNFGDGSTYTEKLQHEVSFPLSAFSPAEIAQIKASRRGSANVQTAANLFGLRTEVRSVKKSVVDYDRSLLCGTDSNGDTDRNCREKIVRKQLNAKGRFAVISTK